MENRKTCPSPRFSVSVEKNTQTTNVNILLFHCLSDENTFAHVPGICTHCYPQSTAHTWEIPFEIQVCGNSQLSLEVLVIPGIQ